MNLTWFKHDSNAHRDAKLRKLILRYGLQGYGLYFYCIEKITDKVSASNLTFRLEDDAEILAHDTRLHVDDVNEMMRFMVDLGLFEDSHGVITCLKLAKRLDQSQTSNPNVRKFIKQVKNSAQNHDGIMTASCQDHDNVMRDKIRLDENRLNNTTKGRRFTPPTVSEVSDYCLERKNSIDAENFVDYYTSRGWCLKGGQKMKDWKATIRTWEKNEKQQQQPEITWE